MEKATFATFFFIFFLLEICNAQKCNQSLPFYDSRNNCTAACPSSHRYNLAGHCMEKCPDSFNFYTENYLCVRECPMNFPFLGSNNNCLSDCPTNSPYVVKFEPFFEDELKIDSIHNFKFGSFSIGMMSLESPKIKICLQECPSFAPFFDKSNNCYSSCPFDIPFWNESHLCMQKCPEKYESSGFYCISPRFKSLIIVIFCLFLIFFIIMNIFKRRREKFYALEFANIESIPDPNERMITRRVNVLGHFRGSGGRMMKGLLNSFLQFFMGLLFLQYGEFYSPEGKTAAILILFWPFDLTVFLFLRNYELPDAFNEAFDGCCGSQFKKHLLQPFQERLFQRNPIQFLIFICKIIAFIFLSFWTLLLMLLMIILSFLMSLFASKLKMLYGFGFFGCYQINQGNQRGMISWADTWIKGSNGSIISECLLFQFPMIVLINVNLALIGNYFQFFPICTLLTFGFLLFVNLYSLDASYAAWRRYRDISFERLPSTYYFSSIISRNFYFCLKNRNPGDAELEREAGNPVHIQNLLNENGNNVN